MLRNQVDCKRKTLKLAWNQSVHLVSGKFLECLNVYLSWLVNRLFQNNARHQRYPELESSLYSQYILNISFHIYRPLDTDFKFT